MERVFREWSSRAGWGPTTTSGSPAASESQKRDGTTDAEADKLREEVSALRDRLRSLEERLQKRKADAK
jgi:predicted nucleic acid-binding Zn ribbon protein